MLQSKDRPRELMTLYIRGCAKSTVLHFNALCALRGKRRKTVIEQLLRDYINAESQAQGTFKDKP